MTPPAQAAGQFGAACLLGLILGLFYGFLRPLGRRHRQLADLLFVPLLVWVWLYLCFGICRGDIRLGCCMGLLLGAVAEEITLGKGLRPLFFGFWSLLSRILGIIFHPIKKIFAKMGHFIKFFIASLKKWVTIVGNNCRSRRQISGGRHDTKKASSGGRKDRSPEEFPPYEDRNHHGHRIVYGGSSGPSRRH